jgi:hypothetical protein
MFDGGDAWPSGSGIINSRTEGPSLPGTRIPAMGVAGLHPGSGPLFPMVQQEGSPLVEEPQFVLAIGGDDTGNSRVKLGQGSGLLVERESVKSCIHTHVYREFTGPSFVQHS